MYWLLLALDFEQEGPAGVLVESVSITEEGALVVVTVSNREPVAAVVVVDAVTDLPEEAQVVVAVDEVWVDLGFPHRENLMSASTLCRSTVPHTSVSMSFFHFNCDSCRSQDK